MASSSASAAPTDGSDGPAVASFASLTTSNASLSEDFDRYQNVSEERRMWNIVYGVREDCVTLIQHFEAKGSLRFQDFAASWRDMMFSHMLSGRPSINLRIEYLQRFFIIIVRLFASGQELVRKVGALYIMYGMYMKLGHGERTLVNIRITPSVWMILKEVRQKALEQNHHDVHFVIDRLLFLSAFAFVAAEAEMSPDLVNRSAWNAMGDPGDEEEEAEENPLQEYLDDGGLQQLSTLHKKYEAIKQKVFGGGSSGRINALGPDLIPGIRARLEAFAKGKRPVDTPAAPEDKLADPTILSERRSARARAFARYSQESKGESESESELESELESESSEEQSSSEEEEQTDDDVDEQDEAPPSQSPPRRGRGRGSRGARRGTRGMEQSGSLGAGSETRGGSRGRSPGSRRRSGGRRGTRGGRGSPRGRGASQGTRGSSAASRGGRGATPSTSGGARGRGRGRPRGRGRGRGETSQ